MASLGIKFSRAHRILPRFSPVLSAQRSSSGRRCLVTSACVQYQETSARSRIAQIPADKYQRTTITEDVQRAAARQGWDDPRAANKVNLEKSSDESMIDPTIRHFTVNFVNSLFHAPSFHTDTTCQGASASSSTWRTPTYS